MPEHSATQGSGDSNRQNDILSATQNAVVAINNLSNTITTKFSSIPQPTLPGGSSGQIQFNNSGSFGGFTMSGDATLVSSTGVITIASHAVTYGKIQTESSGTLLGNLGTGSTSPSEQGSSTVTGFLTQFSTGTQGVVPAASAANGLQLYSSGWGATAAAPAFVLLNTLTAANSSVLSDTTSLTATYSAYEIDFINIVPATNEVIFELQVHSGGVFRSSGGYLFNGLIAGSIMNSSAASFISLSWNVASVAAAILNAAPGYSGRLRVYNPSANAICQMEGTCTYVDGGNIANGGSMGGWWGTAAVVDGFQVFMNSGNMTSGTVKIYGIT